MSEKNTDKIIVYVCDIYKNLACPKTNCHINGGECKHTNKIECALYKDHTEFECWLDNGKVKKMEKVRTNQ